MPTARDRVLQTLRHEATDRAPRDLWVAPGVEMLRSDELAEMQFRYPSDLVRPDFRPPRGARSKGTPCDAGEYIDAWGCVFRSSRRGTAGELVAPPLADASQVAEYRLPWELIERMNLSAINRSCAATSRFVLAMTEVRPFERFQLLRGRCRALADLYQATKPARDLLDMLHDYYAREIEVWAGTDVDGVAFHDEWGTAEGLAIPLDAWRGLFKPMYREFCEILRGRDKFVFFRTGGHVAEIFGDLVEIGIDAIHCQPSRLPFESLAAPYRNRVTSWVGIEEPHLLVQGPVAAIQSGVRHLRSALDFGRGGIIAQCDWTVDVPFDHVAALFEQWLAPLPAHAHAR
jgi:hypothetical protein